MIEGWGWHMQVFREWLGDWSVRTQSVIQWKTD